jgi:antitoxin component HigA of HigAB toxin-antitoxin module
MKNFKAVKRQEVIKLICDGCGLEANIDEGYEFSEFITIEHRCGYGAIHGDGKLLSVDLCQQCFADMCGDTLTVIDPLDNQRPKETLEYNNIFQAITQSKQKANELKQQSDIRISARYILSTNRISNQEELQVALKRVEQLWDAQYRSAEGNELHKLADLICAYENKSWDSYFTQEPLADDDFMPESLNFEGKIPFQEMGAAKSKLSNIPVNKDIDDKNTD